MWRELTSVRLNLNFSYKIELKAESELHRTTSPYWESNIYEANKKFIVYYGAQIFITVFTTSRHVRLS